MDKRKLETCTDSIGTCVVFNCMNFTTNGERDNLKKRDGTEYDGKKIKKTFLKFNFDVVTIDDPTKNDIEEEITKMGMKMI